MASTSEVVFAVGPSEMTLTAERAMLAAQSEVFDAMLFTCPMQETLQPGRHIPVPDCDESVFREFLSFLSTGCIHLSQENLFEVFALARKYLVEGLCERVYGWAKAHAGALEEEYLLQGISVAKDHSCQTLADIFIRTLVRRWAPNVMHRLLDLQERMLPESLIVTILSSDELPATEVEIVRFLQEYQRRNSGIPTSAPPHNNANPSFSCPCGNLINTAQQQQQPLPRLSQALLQAVRFPLMASASLATEVFPYHLLPPEVLVQLFAHAALQPTTNNTQIHPTTTSATTANSPSSSPIFECYDATGVKWQFSTLPRKSLRVLVYAGEDDLGIKGVERPFTTWLAQHRPMMNVEWKRAKLCGVDELRSLLLPSEGMEKEEEEEEGNNVETELPYDCVLMWSYSSSFSDRKDLMDLLTHYVRELGGSLVLMHFGWDKGLGLKEGKKEGKLQGLGFEESILPLSAGKRMTSSRCGIGRVVDPAHPLMYSVNSFNGGTNSYRSRCLLAHPDAQLVAEWEDGTPLVATMKAGKGRVTALNYYPICSTIYSWGWDASTDGFQLMCNALLYRGDD